MSCVKDAGLYDAIILDPPAFGRHKSSGKEWILDRDLPKMFELIPKLLSNSPWFVLISCHDVAWPAERLAIALERALLSSGRAAGVIECGDMVVGGERGGFVDSSSEEEVLSPSDSAVSAANRIRVDGNSNRNNSKQQAMRRHRSERLLQLGSFVRWKPKK
jgi:hypothetical protein